MTISLLARVSVLVVLLLGWASADLWAVDMSGLIGSDCNRCHEETMTRFAAQGGAHEESAECLDCHLQHPEKRGDEFLVVDCVTCHVPDEMVHFSLESCRSCHLAHSPLSISFDRFEGPISSACLSCHTDPFSRPSSAHAENLRCNECHLQHGEALGCQECHSGHSAGKISEPCLRCHHAHDPLPAIAVSDIPAADCAACHPATLKAIASADSSHAEMECDSCHQQHGVRPDCLNCHDGHGKKMVAADCRSCHAPHQPLPPAIASTTDIELCAACHGEIWQAFSASGGRHGQNLSCLDCHEQHPPAAVAPASCSACHPAEASPHYRLPDCAQCHDPHRPAVADLSSIKDARTVCASCHAQTVAVLSSGATAHSETLECNQCHRIHGESPSCLECHSGHSKTMQGSECADCHRAHVPMPVTLAASTRDALCGSCHGDVLDEMGTLGRAHREQLNCVDCHRSHPPAAHVFPSCRDCHVPDERQHFAIGNCQECHDAHRPVKNEIADLAGSRPVCAGCHEQVDQQLKASMSGHDRDCVGCHRRHIGTPSCLGCHYGHSEEMTEDDCRSCHLPHAPLAIVYTGEPSARLCADCHANVSAAMQEGGGRHRSELLCVSCHQRHPAAVCNDCHKVHPQKGIGIPQSCFGCHEPSSQAHFTVGHCQSCHNAHQPLILDLDSVTPSAPVCVTCHAQVAEQFSAAPSGHSEQDCLACHAEHTKKRLCRDCHEPHEQSMKQGDCLLCHSPHQPKRIQLQNAGRLPVRFCAACHESQAQSLAEKGTAHKEEFATCTACHPEHRPDAKQVSKDCHQCHSRAARRHYVLEDCAGCHDPHQPLEINLSQLDEVRPVCVSCHNNQTRLFELYPNKHTEMDCRKCHAGEHGSTLDCQECHSPHIPKLTQVDCLRCHPPHLPQRIREKPGQVEAVCISCHEQAATRLKEQGGAHKSKPCIGCHRSHPPHGEATIPACELCHDADDREHFAVGRCQPCHLGHQPLGHSLADAKNVRGACVSCHEAAAKTFARFPSAHAEQDCNSCHPEHQQSQLCSDCHTPHAAAMTEADCARCHPVPHAPEQISFADALPLEFCSPCHEEQVDALTQSAQKHNRLSCVKCHLGTHGHSLQCTDCHAPPHDPGLHQKYPDCLTCHLDAHDLADWQRSDSGPAGENGAQKKIPEPSGRSAAEDAATQEGLR